MSDNPNEPDFGADDFGEDIPADDFAANEGSLGDMFRNNPLVKVGVVLGAFVTIVAGMILFGGGKDPGPVSMMKGGSDVAGVPGTEQVSQAYREAVEEGNVQAVEDAIRRGTSALPTPIEAPVGRVPLTGNEGDMEDPLERWRRIQEERQKREQQERPPLPEVDPNANAIADLAKAMAAQMESILESQQLPAPEYMQVSDVDFLKQKEEAAAANALAANTETSKVVDIIIPAGTIEYAQLLTEANSDVPGPILAQIVSGPLAGSRILGSFETKDEYLILNFNTVVIDGVSYPAEAVALDPSTANPGMVTDVDHRYFQRVILPAAAAFVEGMGSAIAESGNTSVSVNGQTVTTAESDLDTREEVFKGVEEASSKVSKILDREGQTIRPLVKVASGTAMGLLFVQPVTEEQTQ